MKLCHLPWTCLSLGINFFILCQLTANKIACYLPKKPTLSNHSNNLTPNNRRTFSFPAAHDPAINVNGKGLDDLPEKTEFKSGLTGLQSI